MTGGLAYEGLSDAGQSGEPMVIVLNDNGMSINKNVGGMATLLSKQRVKRAICTSSSFTAIPSARRADCIRCCTM